MHPLRTLAAVVALYMCAPLTAAEPVEQARTAVLDAARAAGINESVALEVTDAYRTRHNGLWHVYFRQVVADLPVVNAIANANIGDDGRVYGAHQRLLVPPPADAVPQAPAISAAAAIDALAGDRALSHAETPQRLEGAPGDIHQVFSGGSVSADAIPVQRVYYHDDGRLRLAWQLVVRERTGSDWWQGWVDAVSGEVIAVDNWTEEADYRVFPLPFESPADGADQIVSDPEDASASPFGWHDTDGAAGAEFTDTRGNNVFAQEDTDANNSGGFRPDGSASLMFDFPVDLDIEQPAEYQSFAITNLFYWNNIIHDILWHYGFDEPAGNFQENNYGNGGAGSDAVNADAQDGSGTNNANFGTPPDGGNPRMQMFVWTNPNGAVLTVNSPGSVAGDYNAAPAAFGAALDPAGTTADLALVDDGSADPELGCSALAGFPSGSIAVIFRGTCEFGTKVLNAQQAGAVAAVVVNNEPGNGTLTMGGGSDGGSVTIPAAMIGNDDGNLLVAELDNGAVNASLVDASAGALDRDSDLDAGVIVHEYGHGLSNRLTGGPSAASCLSGDQQAGEGWSDYLTLMLTSGTANDFQIPRGVGSYLIFQADVPGATIRPAPYTRDLDLNPLTYDDLTNAGEPGGVSIPHGVGTVFATALWDMSVNLVDQHGFDADLYTGSGGNNIALQLVVDGMKGQSCDPTFLEARDAILDADDANSGGANRCLIWEAFARRGMGINADDGGSAFTLNVTADFTLPADCDLGDVILRDGFEVGAR